MLSIVLDSERRSNKRTESGVHQNVKRHANVLHYILKALGQVTAADRQRVFEWENVQVQKLMTIMGVKDEA